MAVDGEERLQPRREVVRGEQADVLGVPADPEVRQAITDYVTWAALGPSV